MDDNVDVYRIARLLIEEHGVFAEDEIRDKIEKFQESGDCNAIKTWYEIESALKEIKTSSEKSKETEDALV